MATLYITEVAFLAADLFGNVIAAPQMPPVMEQIVTISSISTASSAFQPSTRFLQVHTDSVCFLAFGTKPSSSPVATTSNQRLGSGETRFYGVNSGYKLSVISS